MTSRAVLAIVPIVAAALWVNIRTLTLAPVVAVEKERNPFEALKRSWQLTVGNGALFVTEQPGVVGADR